MLALRAERARCRRAMRSLCCSRTCSNACKNSRSSAIRSVGWLLFRRVRYMLADPSLLGASLCRVGKSTALNGDVSDDASLLSDRRDDWRPLPRTALVSSSSAPSSSYDGPTSRAFRRIRCACCDMAVSRLDDLDVRSSGRIRVISSSDGRLDSGSSSDARGAGDEGSRGAPASSAVYAPPFALRPGSGAAVDPRLLRRCTHGGAALAELSGSLSLDGAACAGVVRMKSGSGLGAVAIPRTSGGVGVNCGTSGKVASIRSTDTSE